MSSRSVCSRLACSSVEIPSSNSHGTPADIAATVRFLASPGARQITGQTIAVNGGEWTTR
ncbi:SDR family oxidoreductase [Mycolicibacterium sp. XJ870]